MADPARIILKPRRARPFFARHPWVLDSSIARVEGNPEPGAEVAVVSHERQFIARGLFNPQSTIRVRLYRWTDEPLDDAFWDSRITDAVRLRADAPGMQQPGGACRLVFSEGDSLSGLTAERFDHWLVVHFSSLGLFQRRAFLLERLQELTGADGVIARVDRGVASREGFPPDFEETLGVLPDNPIPIIENDITYLVDLTRGQKTGFYLDQRDNRRAVAAYCRDRKVLDLFCYTGGFALNARKHGGATSVMGVDSSGQAIERAREHVSLNQLDNIAFEEGKVLQVVERLRAEGERFGVIVCDPPKFAQRGADVEHALKGYLRLNRAVLDLLEPGGFLATFSCSGSVDRVLFAEMLGQIAEHSGRSIQILDQLGQPPDHPISVSCLETEYLKCFICRVGG